jgi:hypothetical protein
MLRYEVGRGHMIVFCGAIVLTVVDERNVNFGNYYNRDASGHGSSPN